MKFGEHLLYFQQLALEEYLLLSSGEALSAQVCGLTDAFGNAASRLETGGVTARLSSIQIFSRIPVRGVLRCVPFTCFILT